MSGASPSRERSMRPDEEGGVALPTTGSPGPAVGVVRVGVDVGGARVGSGAADVDRPVSDASMHRTHVYGDNVDTDRLFPGRYLFAAKDDDIKAHALEDLDPGFRGRVHDGDVVVGGRNFGCGSSREQAVACLRLWGVRHVVARSFARIYFRNAVNNGVAPIVCPDHRIEAGDEIAFEGDEVVNLTKGERYPCEALPDFLQEIVAAGGLVAHMRSH